MKNFARNLAAGVILFCGATFGGAIGQMVPNGGGFAPYAALAANFFTGNITYSGTQSAANAALWTSANFSGSSSDSFSAPANALIVPTDTVATSNGAFVDGLLVDHSFGGAASGLRNGLNVRLQQTSTTANNTGNGQAYVGVTAISWGEANDNGTSPSPKGKVFGLNTGCILNGNATFFYRCAGGEVDVTVANGGSVANKLGWAIVEAANDKVAGTNADIGLSIANQVGAVGWTCAICFGTNDAIFPTTTSGTLIGVWGNSQTVPGTAFGTALYGVDFSGVTFSAGGAPYLAPLITPASSAATCKQGSIEWDANFIYICTATSTWKRATLATF